MTVAGNVNFVHPKMTLRVIHIGGGEMKVKKKGQDVSVSEGKWRHAALR